MLCYNDFMVLPESVRQLLWEYDQSTQGAGEGWDRVVIERVMERGLWSDMRWLLASFGRARLREFLTLRGHRVLPPRELRFWGGVCGVAPPILDRWVTAARERERAWRG